MLKITRMWKSERDNAQVGRVSLLIHGEKALAYCFSALIRISTWLDPLNTLFFAPFSLLVLLVLLESCCCAGTVTLLFIIQESVIMNKENG